jgi:hypothetical protein
VRRRRLLACTEIGSPVALGIPLPESTGDSVRLDVSQATLAPA